jgi:bifunctional non-homologous end joining protein LigD
VRLFTRNGHDCSDRFPLITEAALRNRNTSFVIDGEAVLLGVDGRSDFNGLHSRKHDAEVEFYAFDILVSDGEDLRKLPLIMRKANLARLLARRDPPERLRAGRDRLDYWVKVKNQKHPAMSRVQF